MTNLKWNEVGKYNSKIMWDKQDINLPELEQEVLIFFQIQIVVVGKMNILVTILSLINMEEL